MYVLLYSYVLVTRALLTKIQWIGRLVKQHILPSLLYQWTTSLFRHNQFPVNGCFHQLAKQTPQNETAQAPFWWRLSKCSSTGLSRTTWISLKSWSLMRKPYRLMIPVMQISGQLDYCVVLIFGNHFVPLYYSNHITCIWEDNWYKTVLRGAHTKFCNFWLA